MLHTEIVFRLFERTREELLYADYQRVLAGEMSLAVWEEKWKEDASRISIVRSPEKMPKLLTEDSFIPQGMDVYLEKAPRFAPVFRHRHTFFELVYVFNGHCRIFFTADGRDLLLNTGAFLIIAPEYEHLIDIDDENSIVLNIIIRSSTFWSIWQNTLRGNTPVSRFFKSHLFGRNGIPYILFDTETSSDIQYYILESLNEQFEPDEFSNAVKINLISMIFTLLCRHPSSKTTFMESGDGKNSEVADQVISYMLLHFRDCSLESLSEHLHYTTNYCSKVIKESLGLSYSEILKEIRVQKTAELLLTTTMKIADISEHVGYRNPETLIRVFRKHFGITPAEYRKGKKQVSAGEG